MISLRKRVLAAGKRDLVSKGDVTLSLMLPVYAAVAWVLPEGLWGNVVSGLTSLRGRREPGAVEAGVVASGLRDKAPALAQDIEGELERNRLLSYLQYLRDYRFGGWKMTSIIEGDEAIRRAQSDGKGVILWVAHFVFNGLPLKKSLHEAGYQASHLSRPEHGFSSTRFGVRFLNPIRSRIEDRYLKQRILIKRGAEQVALRKAHQLLKQGEIVSITAGHWEGREVANMPVGRAHLPVSTGAPGLAYVTGSVLLPVFIRMQDDGSFAVVIGKSIDVSQCGDRVTAVKMGVEEMSEALQPHIRAAPGQWRGWKYLKAPAMPETAS
jgi:hypothetical protein